jgi:MraZ protein
MPSQPLLIGEHPATLDAEGRIQLPQVLRDEWNPRRADFRLMVNLEADGSLCLREREDWDRFVEDLRRAPTSNQRARRTLLFLAAHSAPVRCDKSGRVRIPDALLRQTGIDRMREGRREVVIVGNFDDLRVWSPDGWDAFREEARADYGAGLDDLLGHRPLGPEGLVDRESA